ncbi:hypothetical protein MBELCI_3099 [Limimaricola cinnabarinus LL-001]|uniref:Uncharacterized protein n=2 Tax=Limimaricola cinnabarinus TaxID=1125964 RepID=U2Z7K8_9RHOB|nr:hypothetical protein MBELCI_3099 [Limimaricola cinnabarinus LL-001]
MQQSRSGGFDCDGLAGRPLGGPEVYTREPHFLGGTWRIAAVTLGGTTGLLDRAASVLRARGQEGSEAHLLRLGPVAGRVLAPGPRSCARRGRPRARRGRRHRRRRRCSRSRCGF